MCLGPPLERRGALHPAWQPSARPAGCPSRDDAVKPAGPAIECPVITFRLRSVSLSWSWEVSCRCWSNVRFSSQTPSRQRISSTWGLSCPFGSEKRIGRSSWASMVSVRTCRWPVVATRPRARSGLQPSKTIERCQSTVEHAGSGGGRPGEPGERPGPFVPGDDPDAVGAAIEVDVGAGHPQTAPSKRAGWGR